MNQAEKDKLAKEHMKLLENVSRSMMRRFGSCVQLDDIRSFAMMGLAKAIDNYDPDRSASFAAYASMRMRGGIYDGLMEASLFPRSLVRKAAFFRKADEIAHYASQDAPVTDKVESVHRLGDILRDITTAYVSIHADNTPEGIISSPSDAEITAEKNQYFARVRAYVEILPERHRDLIKMHYLGDVPLSEVAAHLGRSKSWASRVLRTSLKTLRAQFDDAEVPPDD